MSRRQSSLTTSATKICIILVFILMILVCRLKLAEGKTYRDNFARYLFCLVVKFYYHKLSQATHVFFEHLR